MCIKPNCNALVFIKKRGLCKKHYTEWFRQTQKDNRIGNFFSKTNRDERARKTKKLLWELKPALPDLTSVQLRKLIGLANRYNQGGVARGHTAVELYDFVLWLDVNYGGLCKYCGKRANSLDHITPLSRNGTHTLDNFQLICLDCNHSKWTMTEAEFLGYRKSLLAYAA